ncbi:MAG: hypothetical protein LBD50_01820 [Rickettsiales bacterium]|jgi:hypothetical protein|nr:hypothetical protein [Rickettsiales bacterium]
MKKYLFFIFYSLFFVFCAQGAERVSIFSTSADWEAISGLRFFQSAIDFQPDSKLIGKGLELYFLDNFPCFGQTDSTQIWLGANSDNGRRIRIVCLFAPEKVYFAWRNAARDANQDKTTGILECPVKGESAFKINLSDCVKGKEWKEYK